MDANNKLRQIRRSKEITQEELAKGIGVTRQTIIAIEKGHVKRPADEIMIAIANYLGCEVGDIFFTPLVNHVKQELRDASA